MERSPADQQMQRHLRDAERALRLAADLCVTVEKTNRKEGRDRAESHRASNMQRELGQMLGKLASLGRVSPMTFDDPQDAAKQARLRREALAAKRAARQKQVMNGSQE